MRSKRSGVLSATGGTISGVPALWVGAIATGGPAATNTSYTSEDDFTLVHSYSTPSPVSAGAMFTQPWLCT